MLTIVAHIHAEPAHVDAVKAALVGLIGPTLAETGCMQYDLHQDDEDPSHFMFYENWESRELWQDHMASAHLEAFDAAMASKVRDRVIHEMSRVE